MTREKQVKKIIGFTPRLIDMAGELQLKKGFPSFTAVVQHALIDMHSREFRDYSAKRKQTDESAADAKLNLEEKKKERERNKFLDISKRLDGVISLSGNTEMVEYYTYSKTQRFKQRMPLDHLTEEMVEKQYFPSRQAVEEARKAGKTDY